MDLPARWRRRLLVLALLPALGGPPSPAHAGPPEVLLAERYSADVDPKAYWISEKLDGVRALWDGRRLWLRSGEALVAPDWFTAALPALPLDGELWMGRRSFDRLSALVRRQDVHDPAWREVRYMLFELPGAAGDFSTRLRYLRNLAADAGKPWLQVVPQFRLKDRAALQQRLAEVVAGGGEGLMLHRADAPWVSGRNTALLKLTPWQDEDARVVAHHPGKGRLEGLLGALEVEAPDGRRFRLGSGLTDAQRRAPPPIGSLVTYRYRELTPKGMPRFPRFLRVRELP